jgi:hypothetical protein
MNNPAAETAGCNNYHEFSLPVAISSQVQALGDLTSPEKSGSSHYSSFPYS